MFRSKIKQAKKKINQKKNQQQQNKQTNWQLFIYYSFPL